MRMTATLTLPLPTRDHRKIYRKKIFGGAKVKEKKGWLFQALHFPT